MANQQAKRIRLKPRDLRYHSTDRERGSIGGFAIIFTLVALFGLGFLVDFGNAYTAKAHLRNSIESSLQNAAIKWVHSKGPIPIDPTEFQVLFNSEIQQDLHLDSSFNPLPGSPFDSKLIIERFYVITTVPSVDPVKGDTVNAPSIGVVASSTVPQFLSKSFSATPIQVKEYARVSIFVE